MTSATATDTAIALAHRLVNQAYPSPTAAAGTTSQLERDRKANRITEMRACADLAEHAVQLAGGLIDAARKQTASQLPGGLHSVMDRLDALARAADAYVDALLEARATLLTAIEEAPKIGDSKMRADRLALAFDSYGCIVGLQHYRYDSAYFAILHAWR